MTVANYIEHPNHRVPDEVALLMSRIDKAEASEREGQLEFARLAGPNKEERRQIAEIREAAARSVGLDVQRLRTLSADVSRRVQDELALRPRQIPRYAYDKAAMDLEPVEPKPHDPSFWWARSDWSWSSRRPPEPNEGSAAHIWADWRTDGLHFFGGVTTHDGDLYHDNFGLVALFELQHERIPKSESGLWRSTPHVELFGTLMGSTGDPDFTTGDIWSKCWMYRHQWIFQRGFGEAGPVDIVLGEAHETATLIFEENADRTVYARLNGFQRMPPVTFGGIGPTGSLWARLEVRFGIETEGAGSLLWIWDPEVVVRTFQWPLTVV